MMENHQVEIAIIGGGIAGLATAIGLNNVGIPSLVFEAAPEFKPLGAGLVLATNAMKALEYLGIQKEVESIGLPLQKMRILDARGKEITSTAVTTKDKKYIGYKVHRGDLHEILLSKVNPLQISFGKRLKSIEEKPNGHLLHFEDGTSLTAKTVISAEGIHSKVRQFYMPKSEIRFAGYTCWRGIAENPRIDFSLSSETWGTKGRFGIVPLKNNRAYWFAVVTAPQNDSNKKKWNLEQVKAQFSSYHKDVKEVMNCTANQLIWNDIIDLKPIQKFAFRNTVLIGDAAHATTPNMGQGACMALEDAATLVACFKREKDPEKAFKSFEEKRLKRTTDIVKKSWTLGLVAQNQNAVFGYFRNNMLRLIPDSVSQKQLENLMKIDF